MALFAFSRVTSRGRHSNAPPMSKTRWPRLFIYSVVLGSCCWSSGVVQGSILCACSTSECQRDVTETCIAETFCYVQIIPPTIADRGTPSPITTPLAETGSRKSSTGAVEKDEAVRGCIDDSTPLLCENRRPLSYVGSWPVLLCCRENWCNQNVVPTLPAWAIDIRDQRNATVRVADRKHDSVTSPVSLPSASRHTGNDDPEYYYEEYDDINDVDPLPVPGGRPSRVDDLGKDSVAQHGRRGHHRDGSPLAADSSLHGSSSNALDDGSGISGHRRGISTASGAVDSLFVGLTAAVVCVILVVGAALVLIVAERMSRDRGGSCCGRLCRKFASGDRNVLHKMAELPLYRCRCSAERAAPNRPPSPLNVPSTTTAPFPVPTSPFLPLSSASSSSTYSGSDRTFSRHQEPLLLLPRQSQGAADELQLPDLLDRQTTSDEPTTPPHVEMSRRMTSTPRSSRLINCLPDYLPPESRCNDALGALGRDVI